MKYSHYSSFKRISRSPAEFSFRYPRVLQVTDTVGRTVVYMLTYGVACGRRGGKKKLYFTT